MAREKILVVDDSPTDLRLMTAPLREKGYRVFTAVDGEEALDVAMRERPHLIVLDIILPKKNGFQVCRQVRGDPLLKNVPILFLTAKTKDEDKIEGFRAGGDDYLSKPIDREKFCEKINVLLSEKTQNKT